MFERFTERARQVVTLAQEEARYYGYKHISTDHILLGLLREEEGLAATALANLGLTADNYPRNRLENFVKKPLTVQIPFSPEAKKVFEGALKEALSLGHSYIGTEHILLALSSTDGSALGTFNIAGIEAEDIRDEVTRLLSGPKTKQQKLHDKKWNEERRKKEEEILNEAGQNDLEEESKKVAVTITFGNSTFKYEGEPSSLASQLIKSLSGSLSKT